MAETAHLAWYRQGTVSATDGSTKVTGNGTKFLTAGINQGAAFRIDNHFYVAEIKRVVSDTELELATPYYGGTVSDAAYSIDRNHQSTLPADLAARLAKAMGNWEARYDLDMQSITGKSAYEVAVENGYTGTVAQWLESLKGADEIVTLNNRTNILTYGGPSHNAFYRGKNLGTSITAAQIAAIRDNSFTDIYPGDYWELPIDGTTTAYVMGCNHSPRVGRAVTLWLKNSAWAFNFNDTDTCEGHFMNSKMYTVHLPYILAKIKEVIPDDYILKTYDFLGDSIDSSGNVNHRTEVQDIQIFLPSIRNLTGNDDGYQSKNAHDRNARNPVWPACHLNPRLRQNNFFWLDNNVSAIAWASWHSTGQFIQSHSASRVTVVYPYIYLS